MPKINFVLPFLVLIITSQGFVNGQTRTPSQRDAKEQWQTTEKVQPEPPLRTSLERFKQQHFEIIPSSALPSGASSASAATADKEPAVPTPTVSAVDSRSSSVEATEASETANYRVGVGDVLEIRVTDSPVDAPTLFTVSVSGLLDYPVLPEPLKVLGLTTNEVGERLGNELKRRALSDKQVLVGVSEYNSHRILISGLVNEHGTKILRREAIPLYVVLADAHPLPEAGVVTVISLDRKITTVDLATPLANELLIRHGDVVMVQANPKLFFYVGGEVKAPGEKTLRQGLKLTQAILLAGGLTRVCRTVELAREGTNGRLELSVYKLYDINSGKLPDPPIQAGDRITIVP